MIAALVVASAAASLVELVVFRGSLAPVFVLAGVAVGWFVGSHGPLVLPAAVGRAGVQEALARQAFHDPLTGLPNRALYIDRLEHTLRRRRRDGRSVAVLFLDLDDFKTVNDSLGHVEGDVLIAAVGARLAATIRPGDTAGRIGGDEFAILLEDVDEAVAIEVAERVLGAFEEPFEVTERSLRIGASIGIALSSSELPTATDMLRAADVAMYHAKGSATGHYRLFEPAMQRKAEDRLRLGADLRGAIDRGEFVLHYQPVVSLADGSVTGMEALLRWLHPERGLIGPAAFIGLAESSGLIVPLGEFVLGEACRQARGWQLEREALGQRPVSLNVNLSGVQLQHPGIVDAVRRSLEASGLPANLLTLEITESVMGLDADESIHRLHQLKGLGVRLAIDDFGTGYSSLSYLSRFPIDLVKIDKSFVDGIDEAAPDLALVRAIVRLAHSLRITAAAEGVETEGQAKRLASTGCDLAQGFHFSRPLDAAQATDHVLGRTTVTMWVGHTDSELEVIAAAVADYEASHPGVRVDLRGGVDDERTLAALRAGHAPDVVSSFESENFGHYASAGGLIDLDPLLARDGIPGTAMIEATNAYTRYEGRRFALPMLVDVYGLYLNAELLARAGLARPPRTMAELSDYAKRLTVRAPDGSLEIVGFNPLVGFYENAVGTLGHSFGAAWTDATEASRLARDPAWSRMLRWQRELVDWFGYEELVRFGDRVGAEFAADNAFATGRLAMMLDGEWRVAFLEADAPDLRYLTAPVPVDEARPDLYGSGYINGTIIGIPVAAPHPAEAWELVRHLATEPEVVARLATGLRNVPSIKAALTSPALTSDPHFAVFLEIFAHPRSTAAPMSALGSGYQDVFTRFVEAWQAGRIRDLEAGLADVAAALDAELRRTRREASVEPLRRASEGAGPVLRALARRDRGRSRHETGLRIGESLSG